MDLSKYYGNYRAKVLKNYDETFFGRILVFIPDIMPDIDPDVPPAQDTMTNGLWAYPANNPLGGRSGVEDKDQWGHGSCYIPKIGSYVWVFFEGGNINRPWYFGSCDIETSKVLPENQVGRNPQNKWTIFKSSEGRCIIISDDCDERIEITGKKRQLEKSISHPEGDTSSIYPIDDNQTSIILEETDGNEKLLIRTYQGDYINIDITNRELHCEFENDIYFKTNSDFYIDAQNIHLNAREQMFLTSGEEMNISGSDTYVTATENSLNLFCDSMTNLHGGKAVSVVSDSDLMLTGKSSIHQSTSLNLIGGDINIGLIIPRKASAMPGATAGEAGEASLPNPYGERAAYASMGSCSITKKKNTNPTEGKKHKEPEEYTPPDPILKDPITPPHDNSLIPSNMTPNKLFERKNSDKYNG